MNPWIPVAQELPPLDLPVWVQCDHGGTGQPAIFIAERADSGDGWLWCRCRCGDSIYRTNNETASWKAWRAEEGDDQPVAWMHLPELYKP